MCQPLRQATPGVDPVAVPHGLHPRHGPVRYQGLWSRRHVPPSALRACPGPRCRGGMTTLTGPAAEVRRRPSTRGYWLAAALALVGVLGAGAWVFASYARAAADPAAFTRVATTGPAAVTIDRAGTYAVYYEAPYGMMMGSAPGMSVTGPAGRTLAMRPGYGMRDAAPRPPRACRPRPRPLR